MNVSQLRAGIAANLSTIPDVQINPYALAQPTPPGLQVLPPGVQYDRTMHRGLDEWLVIVQGFVALTSDIGSQTLLDQMCAPSGSSSVKAALESDRTLGGKVQDLHVLEQTPGVVVNSNEGNPMLLVEWRVQVYANGS